MAKRCVRAPEARFRLCFCSFVSDPKRQHLGINWLYCYLFLTGFLSLVDPPAQAKRSQRLIHNGGGSSCCCSSSMDSGGSGGSCTVLSGVGGSVSRSVDRLVGACADIDDGPHADENTLCHYVNHASS